MNRQQHIDNLKSGETFDLLIIGGGATGLGTALDAVSRGYTVALVEQHDFAKGTSSRSTKLVHGGVRYLKQGNIALVLEALRERGRLYRNAPHLVHNMGFVIPVYKWWDGPFYGIGMKIYDGMAGRLGLSPSRMLSKQETIERIPTVETEGLQGGVEYYDGQFDDARLAVNLAQSIADDGGTIANYVRADSLMHEKGLCVGAVLSDVESGGSFEVRARAVINATGIFADRIRHMDDKKAPAIVTVSQGSHLVLPKRFLPGDSAIMVPKTHDGRVMFAVPWHGRVVVGTTDIEVAEPKLEPLPMDDEVEFLLTHAAQYLQEDPAPGDVLSLFAGLRPLVASGDTKKTASISRDHTIVISGSGLITVTGGKWTTYRKMAEDVIDNAAVVADLPDQPCRTRELHIHGWVENHAEVMPLSVYGSDAPTIRMLISGRPDLGEKLHPELPYLKAEVVWAARHEMARTTEDVLSRRTRALLLGAKASMEAAPEVARLLAIENRKSDAEMQNDLENYLEVAKNYLIA